MLSLSILCNGVQGQGSGRAAPESKALRGCQRAGRTAGKTRVLAPTTWRTAPHRWLRCPISLGR
eukprot:11563674-Alexandrium_andersonii.AAC.1